MTIDREAKLTTANIKAIAPEFRNCTLELTSAVQLFVNGPKGAKILTLLVMCQDGRWEWIRIGTISTIGELIDWYERLTGRQWPEKERE